MASSKQDQAKLVAEWAKAQAALEEAQEKADAARKVSQGFAQKLYSEFGSEPFSVKSLGRRYRAIHKKERKNDKGTILRETYAVLPLAENAPTREF